MSKKINKYPELIALKGRMREKKITYRKLASDLGIALNTFSDKINGFYPFTAAEMEIIAEYLEIWPMDIARFFLPLYFEKHQKSYSDHLISGIRQLVSDMINSSGK